MSNEREARSYIDFDPATGYPAGPDLYYECLRCGVVVPSMPPDSISCRCNNIMIDTDYGRFKVEDSRKIRLFRVAKAPG